MSDKHHVGEFFFRRLARLGITAALLLFSSSFSLAEADRYWRVTSGDWSTATNWGGTEPVSDDFAYIDNGGKAIVTQVGELSAYLGLGITNTGTVEMISGSLTILTTSVGKRNSGTFIQLGGTHKTNSLYLGEESAGANGTYNLSGTGVLNAIRETIGNHGTGTFNHSAGTNTVSNRLISGYNSSNSNGTYNLSGTGSLNAYRESIRNSGDSIQNY